MGKISCGAHDKQRNCYVRGGGGSREEGLPERGAASVGICVCTWGHGRGWCTHGCMGGRMGGHVWGACVGAGGYVGGKEHGWGDGGVCVCVVQMNVSLTSYSLNSLIR